MDSILTYDPTLHPDDKPPDYVSSHPRRLSPDEAKMDQLSNYAKQVLGNISYVAPYLKNGNFHEVIGIKEGSTLSEFTKCREGKSKPPYIRSSYPRSHNVHSKLCKADNHQSSSDHKSRRNAYNNNQMERSSGKSSPRIINHEQSKSKKDHQYNVNSTTDHTAPVSQHYRVLSDRNVKTELHDASAIFPVVTSKKITPKTEVDSKQFQLETGSTTNLDTSEDLKSSRKKLDPKLENKDALSQSNETSSKSKPAKSDNDMKGNSIRPKHLTIDIIKNGIAKEVMKSNFDTHLLSDTKAKVKKICEEMVGLAPPISAIRTPSSSSSAFPAFHQKDESIGNDKDLNKSSEENTLNDDQNCLARDLELTDDSDIEAESESSLTKSDSNATSGKLFPATDPMRLSESSSDSDSSSKGDKQLKKRKLSSSGNENHPPIVKKSKRDNVLCGQEENTLEVGQHSKFSEDDEDNCNREPQNISATTEALPSSMSLQNVDKSYPINFDLVRLKNIHLSPSITKKQSDEQVQVCNEKKSNVNKRYRSNTGSKNDSSQSDMVSSKRSNEIDNHLRRKKLQAIITSNDDEDNNVQTVSSRKGLSAEKNEIKLDKTSDESSTLITSVKLSEKNRSKVKKIVKTSEDDSSLIYGKKDKKRSKELKYVKTSDEDSSSSHRKISPSTRDKDRSEIQDRSKSSECRMSQSNHLDSDDGRYHKTVPLMTESNSGRKSDLAWGSFGNKLSKKNGEEASTIEELRIKSENLRKQATECKRSGDANPNVEAKAIKYTEAAMLFIEQALIEEKLDKGKPENRKKETYYDIITATATFLKQICRILRDPKDGGRENIKLKKILFFCDKSRALLIHKTFLRSRNEVRTLLQSVSEHYTKDKQQIGSISKNNKIGSDLSISPTSTLGSQVSTSNSGSTQNDSCVSIPNKVMSMQLRLNHLWNQETYALDLWENCNSIIKEFEDFFMKLHHLTILHYDSTLDNLLDYVRRGMKLISKD